jgi:hypothetical protein
MQNERRKALCLWPIQYFIELYKYIGGFRNKSHDGRIKCSIFGRVMTVIMVNLHLIIFLETASIVAFIPEATNNELGEVFLLQPYEKKQVVDL